MLNIWHHDSGLQHLHNIYAIFLHRLRLITLHLKSISTHIMTFSGTITITIESITIAFIKGWGDRKGDTEPKEGGGTLASAIASHIHCTHIHS